MARITCQDLISAAKSGDERERKKGFAQFQMWVRSESKLPTNQRLTYMEKSMLEQLFAQKGLKVERRR